MIPDKQIILFFIFYLISQLIFDRYIYKKINELEDFLNKKGDNLSKVSRSVPLKIPISNSFYNNLFELRNLADLLKKEGIYFEQEKLINTRMG